MVTYVVMSVKNINKKRKKRNTDHNQTITSTHSWEEQTPGTSTETNQTLFKMLTFKAVFICRISELGRGSRGYSQLFQYSYSPVYNV